jgi:hypothetical protein
MILGIIQTVGGLLGIVLSSPFAVVSNTGREIFFRSASHFVNGLANVVASPLEATPIIGTIFFVYRYLRKMESEKMQERIHTGQEHTLLIGYRKLENYPISYEKKDGSDNYPDIVFDKKPEELNTMKAEANRRIWNLRLSPSISI